MEGAQRHEHVTRGATRRVGRTTQGSAPRWGKGCGGTDGGPMALQQMNSRGTERNTKSMGFRDWELMKTVPGNV